MLKVTVEYTTSKISKTEALLNQLSLAKEITNQLKDETYPVIEAVGKAKYDAIMNQIQPLIAGFKGYRQLTGNYDKSIWYKLRDGDQYDEVYFSIDDAGFRTGANDIIVKFKQAGYYYTFDWDKESKRMMSPDGILCIWDDKAIETMQNQLNELIEKAIAGQEKEQKAIKSRLNQIID